MQMISIQKISNILTSFRYSVVSVTQSWSFVQVLHITVQVAV